MIVTKSVVKTRTVIVNPLTRQPIYNRPFKIESATGRVVSNVVHVGNRFNRSGAK